MAQYLLPPETKLVQSGFSVGICAADRATNLKSLLSLIEQESYPQSVVLRKIIVVASGCEPATLSYLKADYSGRVILIREPERRGKSEAINQIIDQFDGDFLVLVNSDAMPEKGAISRLLKDIARDDEIGVISASPQLNPRSGLTGAVLSLIWGVHNQCLLTLNANNQNNHCCDELVVVRTKALQKLPKGTVNDGAFLAGSAYQAGYTIRFSNDARVFIDVPTTIWQLMQQRRRILYGHMQILRSVGQSPRTVESLLADNPTLSLSILVKTLARSPLLLAALPVAIVSEAMSTLLALFDTLSSNTKHAKWVRFGKRG